MEYRVFRAGLLAVCLSLSFPYDGVCLDGSAAVSKDMEIISYGSRDDATLERESRTDPNAQAEWGRRLLIRGKHAEAVPFLAKAAEQGILSALTNYGYLLVNGLGVAQNVAKARSLFLRAADLGNATAMNNLGWMYQNGHGSPVDYSAALTWYRRAAAEG